MPPRRRWSPSRTEAQIATVESAPSKLRPALRLVHETSGDAEGADYPCVVTLLTLTTQACVRPPSRRNWKSGRPEAISRGRRLVIISTRKWRMRRSPRALRRRVQASAASRPVRALRGRIRITSLFRSARGPPAPPAAPGGDRSLIAWRRLCAARKIELQGRPRRGRRRRRCAHKPFVLDGRLPDTLWRILDSISLALRPPSEQ